MAKILAVLYPDPVDGYPKTYARDDVPKIDHYPDGQIVPNPQSIDFKPGQLLGSVSGELGLRKYLEGQGHTLVVTSDKDGPNSVFERELPDADIVISQPFWPAYLTKERFAKAKNLKLAITAGIGSDHIDLQAAMDKGITVAEITYSNSISVAEHVVMMILSLVRNYLPSYEWVKKGGWNIADCVERSYDLEGMNVGSVAAGRIGLAVLRRLKPFDVKLHYTDKHRLPEKVEKELGPHLSQGRRVHGQGVRRRHHQRAAASRNRGHVQRQADREDEARLVYHQHGARQDRRPRCRRARAGERPTGRLRRRRVVPETGAEGSPVAHHAPSRHDAAHLRLILSAQARYAAGTREILESYLPEADPHRVPDRRQGQTGRYRRTFLQRRRCDQGRG